MAKPIRFGNMQVEAQPNLPGEYFNDYEELEKRLESLTGVEKKYYDLLRKWAITNHILALKQLDDFLK